MSRKNTTQYNNREGIDEEVTLFKYTWTIKGKNGKTSREMSQRLGKMGKMFKSSKTIVYGNIEIAKIEI